MNTKHKLPKLSKILSEVLWITLVVGPSSFSATQLCRLNDRSLHFTRIRFPNFSSNGLISGSIPEKSNLCIQTGFRYLKGTSTNIPSLFQSYQKDLCLVVRLSHLLIWSLLPVCLHPMWRALAEFHFSFLTRYLWRSEEKHIQCISAH